MTLRDDLLETVNDVRGIAGDLGLRVTTITIRKESWSGLKAGLGVMTPTDTVLSPVPKVVRLSPERASIVAAGLPGSETGRLNLDLYQIGPITPNYSGGGYTSAQLVPSVANDSERALVILSGADFETGGEPFEVVRIESHRAFRHMLIVQRAQKL